MSKKAKTKTRRKNRKIAGGPGRKRKKTLRRILAGAACLVLGAALGAAYKLTADYIRRTPLFNISEVVIKNSGSNITDDEVLKLAGVREGKNIFSFRLAESIQAVEFHPWVKAVSMRRQLPDRVVMEIEERTPLAIVAMGSLYYLDKDLEIFKKVMPWDSINFPVITGLTLREAIENGPEMKRELKKADEIMRLAARSSVLPLERISEIHIDRTIGVEVWTAREAVKIRLGDSGFHKKWTELERVIIELDENMEKVALLDMNCEGRVTAKLKQGYQVARDESTVLLKP